ncbi:MAG: phosphotransferase [Butyrivibrio sp.]|nr:phosphotransferase [Butyrivibrio sp.]
MFFKKKKTENNKNNVKVLPNALAVCSNGHTFSLEKYYECPFCNPSALKKETTDDDTKKTGPHGTRIITLSADKTPGSDGEGITRISIIGEPLKSFTSEGLERLGGGAEGTVYALDDDRILKIYRNADELQIRKWYRNIRTVSNCGIRCAKAYEMVKADEGYGIIFERLDGKNLGWTINDNPDKLDDYALKMGLLLKKLHSSKDDSNTFERITERMLGDLKIVEERQLASGADVEMIKDFFRSIVDRNTLVHSDYHEGNIIVDQEGELVLIDLDRMGVGHPIYDLIGNYLNHDVLLAKNPQFAIKSWGLDGERISRIKRIMLESYFGTGDESRLNEYLDVVRNAFYVRATLLSVSPLLGKDDDEAKKAYIKDRLSALSCSVKELSGRINNLPI